MVSSLLLLVQCTDDYYMYHLLFLFLVQPRVNFCFLHLNSTLVRVVGILEFCVLGLVGYFS